MGGSKRFAALVAVSRNVPEGSSVPDKLFFIALRHALSTYDFGRAPLWKDACVKAWQQARKALKLESRADKVRTTRRAEQLLKILKHYYSPSLCRKPAPLLALSGWDNDRLGSYHKAIVNIKVHTLLKQKRKLVKALNVAWRSSSVRTPAYDPATLRAIPHTLVPVLIHLITDDYLSPLHFVHNLLPKAPYLVTKKLAFSLWSRTLRRLEFRDDRLFSHAKRLYRNMLAVSMAPRRPSSVDSIGILSRKIDVLQHVLSGCAPLHPALSFKSPPPHSLYFGQEEDALKTEKIKRRSLRLGTYNPGTLAGNMDTILAHCRDFDVDLLALQETRLKNGKPPRGPPGYDWYGHSRVKSLSTPRTGGGTGWLVNKSSVRRYVFLPLQRLASLIDYPPKAAPVESPPAFPGGPTSWTYPDDPAVERTWMKIDTHPTGIFACSISWPPGKSPPISESLRCELRFFSTLGEIIIAGDTNADYLSPKVSNRKKNLLGLLAEHEIVLQNDRIPTHQLQADTKFSLIDWISSTTPMKKIHVNDTGDKEYGHLLVSGELRTRWGRPPKTTPLPRPRRDLLEDMDVKSAFTTTCSTALNKAPTLPSFHAALKSVVIDTLSIPRPRRMKQEWWSKDLDALIAARRAILKNPPSPDRRLLFRKLTKTLRKTIARKKKLYWFSFWNQINSNHGDARTIWRVAKKSRDSPAPPSVDSKPTNNAIDQFWSKTWRSDDLEEEWTEFNAKIRLATVRTQAEEKMCSSFSLSEVQTARQRLAKNKAADLDGLCAEFLQVLPLDSFSKTLLPDVNKLWSPDNVVPACLSSGRVVTLFKKGDPRCAPNYRPISILSVFYRLIETMVFNRISSYVESKLSKYQAGFRQGRSCLQQALLLRMVQDHAEREGKRVFVALLDLRKAFDTVPHSRLALMLLEFGLPSAMCSLIMRLTACHVNTLPTGSEVIIGRGVPQGSILGPFLFDIYVNSLVTKLEEKTMKQLPFSMNQLMYADDTAVLAYSAPSLTGKLTIAAKWSAENRMTFAPEKTIILVFGPPLTTPPQVRFQGLLLPESKDAIYLGVPFKSDGPASTSARKAMDKWMHLKGLIGKKRQRGISVEKCLLLYKSLMASTFLFASVVADVDPRATLLQNEVAAAILRSMRFSLIVRNHMALGLWPIPVVVKFKRAFSLMCWMMPVFSNELIGPVLRKEFSTVHPNGSDWLGSTVSFLNDVGVFDVMSKFRDECEASGSLLWSVEKERRKKMWLKRVLKKKCDEVAAEWFVSKKKYELVEETVRKVDVVWLKEKWTSKVLMLCRGEMGNFGAMVLRNHLTLPGEKTVASCYLCDEAGKDTMSHLVGECNGRAMMKKTGEKELKLVSEIRTSRRYPLELNQEECVLLQRVAKWMWALREKKRDE